MRSSQTFNLITSKRANSGETERFDADITRHTSNSRPLLGEMERFSDRDSIRR